MERWAPEVKEEKKGRQVLKSTTLLTNMPTVVSRFDKKVCTGDHEHARASGNEEGQTRSSYCAIYPAGLVSALVEATLAHVGGMK